VTITGSAMQSGVSVTRTENQKEMSKNENNKNSATNFEHKCALVSRIHVSFARNQKLASCCVTVFGSEMQSGTKTEIQKKVSKNNTQLIPARTQQQKRAVLPVAASLAHAIRIRN
jgi:hypothetical protein